jgi:hypothetical protein
MRFRPQAGVGYEQMFAYYAYGALEQPPPGQRGDAPAAAPRSRDMDNAVFDYLTRHPGARAGEIAKSLGTGQGAVSAHLYRGKDRLFSSRGGRWFPIPAADPAAA